MTDETDWRLTNQAKYLLGVALSRKSWVQRRPDWDHDHCAFCWAKFAAIDGPGILNEGYATLDEAHWICPGCFSDFRERFRWQVVGH